MSGMAAKFVLPGLAVLLFCGKTALAQAPAEPLRDSDFATPLPRQVELGRLLFHDRALSGSYRVSCATCHNHDRASGNGALLPGKTEPDRDELATNGENPWAPWSPSARHAPVLFNLGHRDFTRLFSDGRVSLDTKGDLHTPAGDALPKGLSGVLAAQALFPTVSADELTPDEPNSERPDHAALWNDLLARLLRIDAYPPLFAEAFEDVSVAGDVRIHHVANAIAAFVATEWRSDDAPFDRYLKGQSDALSEDQKRGLRAFYGSAGCAVCHAGAMQTDHDFHAAGLTGPDDRPEAEAADAPRWQGRFNITGVPVDLGKVRTPSLRNVTMTGPWGLAGQYDSLAEVIRAHRGYLDMDERALENLLGFLQSLTDEKSLKGRLGKPAGVPSDLALD